MKFLHKGLIAFFLLIISHCLWAIDVQVSSLNDSGTGSLRDAITQINASTDANNNIIFSVSGTILLNSVLPTITKSVVIDGNNQITIDGQTKAFHGLVISGKDVTIKNLTIQNASGGISGEIGADRLLIDGVTSRNTTLNNITSNGEYTIIQNSFFYGSASTGIVLRGFASIARNNVVGFDGVNVIPNLKYGIVVLANDCVVENNQIIGTRTTTNYDAIRLGNNDSNLGLITVNNCVIRGNKININQDNTALNVTGYYYGIRSYSSSNCQIENNVIAKAYYALSLFKATTCHILNNQFGGLTHSNNSHNIYFEGNSSSNVKDIYIDNNVFSHKAITILAYNNNTQNIFIKNNIIGLANSAHAGIEIRKSNNYMTKNVVIENNDIKISGNAILANNVSGLTIKNNRIGTDDIQSFILTRGINLGETGTCSTVLIEENIIAGTTSGEAILLHSFTISPIVRNNKIGVNSMLQPLGSFATGVFCKTSTSLIEKNTIHNSTTAIEISAGINNKISQNVLVENITAIEFSNNGNNNKAAPVITTIEEVDVNTIKVSGTSSGIGDVIELFLSDGNNQSANIYIACGEIKSDANFKWSVQLPSYLFNKYRYITTTATNVEQNTSLLQTPFKVNVLLPAMQNVLTLNQYSKSEFLVTGTQLFFRFQDPYVDEILFSQCKLYNSIRENVASFLYPLSNSVYVLTIDSSESNLILEVKDSKGKVYQSNIKR